MHYLRLIYRSVLFIVLLTGYIVNKLNGKGSIIGMIESIPAIIWTVWAVFVAEMIFRFFPSKIESPGCQKQFLNNL